MSMGVSFTFDVADYVELSLTVAAFARLWDAGSVVVTTTKAAEGDGMTVALSWVEANPADFIGKIGDPDVLVQPHAVLPEYMLTAPTEGTTHGGPALIRPVRGPYGEEIDDGEDIE